MIFDDWMAAFQNTLYYEQSFLYRWQQIENTFSKNVWFTL